MARFLDPKGSDGLYGPNRDSARTDVKDLLSQKSVLRQGEWFEDTKDHQIFPWSTTTSASFKAPSREKPEEEERRDIAHKEKSLKTNFILGSESNTKFATTAKDFDSRLSGERDKEKHDYWNTNIPDFAPRYMADTSFGKKSPTHAAGVHEGSQIEKTAKNIWDRKMYTKDLRLTHFQLGSDPDSFRSETGHCFASGSKKAATEANPDTASIAARETYNSRVFRQGDWNVTRRNLIPHSVTRADFHLAPFAAGISTRTSKTFDHVHPRQARPEDESRTNNLRRQIQQAILSKFASQRDPSSANIRQAFAGYDRERSGFVTREELQAVINQFQTVTDEELDALIAECKPGRRDDKLDYLEFGKFLTTRLEPVAFEKAFTTVQQDSFTDLPHSRSRLRSPPGGPRDDPSHPYYHRSSHFLIGTNSEEPRSMYYKDFMQGKRECLIKPFPAPAPMSSKVLPELDNPPQLKSTKQADFVDHTSYSRDIGLVRKNEMKKNQGRHTTVVVDLSVDPRDTEAQRIASLTGADFKPPPKEYPWLKPTQAPISKYRYLDTNGALPYPPKDPYCSEAKEHYVRFSELTSESAGIKRKEKKAECQGRISDNRRTHFQLGSDEEIKFSEQHHQFSTKIPLDPRMLAAGKTEVPEQKYSHVSPSESAEEAPAAPSARQKAEANLNVAGAQEQMRQLNMERYFNPRDPVNINVRKAFLEHDTSLSGVISKRDLKSACGRLRLQLTPEKLEHLFQSCGKDREGNINYHEFIRNLTQDSALTRGIRPAKSSVMKEDYLPPEQRRFTSAQQRAINTIKEFPPSPIIGSHYFHLEHSPITHRSTTNNDFTRPDLAPGASRLAAPAGR